MNLVVTAGNGTASANEPGMTASTAPEPAATNRTESAGTWWARTGHHLPPVALVILGSVIGFAAAPFVGLIFVAVAAFATYRVRHHRGWCILMSIVLAFDVVVAVLTLLMSGS